MKPHDTDSDTRLTSDEGLTDDVLQVDEKAETPPTTDRSTFLMRFTLADGRGLILNAAAVVALALAIGGAPAAVVLVLGLLILLGTIRTPSRLLPADGATGSNVLARVLLTFSVAALDAAESGPSAAVIATSALLAFAVATEVTVSRVLRAAIPYAVNVPGLSVRNTPAIARGWPFLVNVAALILLALLTTLAAPGWELLVLALPSAVLSLAMLADGVLRIRARRVAERRLPGYLADYAPVFAFHWDAPAEEAFQLSMWLPYLERLGVPFMVLVRNPKTFEFATTQTDQPVLLRRELADLDAVVVPSLKTAFYVNNNTRNQHFIRYTQLKHIHLNHGESDKAPSYSPLFRLFDKNFVAGQAAIDRFAANGVWMRPDAFSIVGRPQVEAIDAPGTFIGDVPEKTVMYAPTWSGFFADSRYSSLTVGYDIVEALVGRGCTVLFRPHPYTDKSATLAREAARIRELLKRDAEQSGRRHLTGVDDLPDATIGDWFNLADALISDVSSVVPDFLYSEKPYAMTAMAGPVDTFVDRFPVSRGSYVIRPDLANLSDALDRLLVTDPIREERRALKKYYLGDFPHENYADAFLNEARKYL